MESVQCLFLVLTVLEAPKWVLGVSMPVMDTTEITINIEELNSAILPCTIKTITPQNKDKYKVIWMSPGSQLISVAEEMLMNNNRYNLTRPYPSEWNLRISPVRAEDAGKYSCQINTKPFQMRAVILNVQVRPRISSSPTVDVREGQTLRVYCNTTGTPKPTLSWEKDGTSLPQFTDEVLIIPNVSRQNAGKYKCTASNDVDRPVSKDTAVIVHYPPIVKIHNDKIGQERYKDAIMECHSSGIPLGRISWLRDEKFIQNNWKYELQTFTTGTDGQTLSLRIRDVQARDFGEYTCETENDAGIDEDTIILYEVNTPVSSFSKVTLVPPTNKGQGHSTVSTGNPAEQRDNGTVVVIDGTNGSSNLSSQMHHFLPILYFYIAFYWT